MPIHKHPGGEGMPDIVATEGIMGGKARIRGYRIAVVDIVEMVETGYSPATIAERLDLDQREVEAALDYASAHPDEIEAAMESREELYDELTGENSA